ncbi:MAG: hypothetical protein J6C15_09160 [Bacteroidaceae bacterium]|nr:hypothetical protein [Bacteroidaceae bacterium]
MKKIYDAPVAELLDITVDNILVTISIPEGGETDEFDTKENRNDWNNIWGEMQ